MHEASLIIIITKPEPSKIIFLHAVLGVTLEYGLNQESNNTLITVSKGKLNDTIILCSTDRIDCCTDELSITRFGNWFLPNGSEIASITGNQTIGLNLINNTALPRGIYHCEMMDRNNVTHHLYAGIYPDDEGMC